MKGPYKLFTEGGHAFEVDEKGELISWEHDFHDGFICILCGESLCRNCDKDWKTQPCPENKTALPGLELEVTHEGPSNRK